MSDGRVEVHGTMFGFMIFGLSMQSLYWYAADREGRASTMLVKSLGGRPAWRCDTCELTTISSRGEETPARRGKASEALAV